MSWQRPWQPVTAICQWWEGWKLGEKIYNFAYRLSECFKAILITFQKQALNLRLATWIGNLNSQGH